MPVFLKIDCERCDTPLIVGQPETFKEVGEQFGFDTEVQLAGSDGAVVDDGSRVTYADVNRMYRCPKCGAEGNLPPADELERMP